MDKYPIPHKWIQAGSNPENYDMGVDPDVHFHSMKTACLQSKANQPEGFGTLMQICSAESFAGKRIRLQANIRTEEIDDWAGAWLRVDPWNPKYGSLAFDNMSDRPIKGTNDWAAYDIVLDVPEESHGLAYGTLLSGPGKLWMADLKVEVVGSDVPVTCQLKEPSRPNEPTNLDFAE